MMDFVHYHAPTYRDSKMNADGSEEEHESDNVTSTPNRFIPPSMSLNKPGAAEPGAAVPAPVERAGSRTGEEVEETEMPGDMSTRPRLTREQALLLEQHFELHYKPNTTIKKELAEKTGLSLQRVANWFQNRRAKAKQQKRQGERELQQSLEAAGRSGVDALSTPSYFYPNSFASSEHDQTPRQSMGTAAISPGHQPMAAIDSTYQPPQYESSAEATYASLSRSLAAATAAVAEGAYTANTTQNNPEPSFSTANAFPPSSASIDSANSATDTSVFSDWGSSRDSSITWTPVRPLDDPFDATNLCLQQPVQEPLGIQEVHANFSNAIEANNFKNPFVIPIFPSQVARIQQFQQDQQQTKLQQVPQPASAAPENKSPPGIQQEAQQEQPASDALQSSETGDNPTGSSPDDLSEAPSGSLNIAARRKRPRPAALGGAALRSHSYMGSFPVSPGAKGPFLGPPSPVRRIKSAGNNVNLSRGRIQKPSPGSAQRSPLNFETFADSCAFGSAGMRLINQPAPTTSESVPVSGSLAPPTPLSPLDIPPFQNDASSGAGQDEPGFIYSPGYPGCFVPTTVEMQPNIASPPTTPHYGGLQAYQQSLDLMNYSPAHSGGYVQYSQGINDEAIISPQIVSFPTQIHMPQPVYVSPINAGHPTMASPFQNEVPFPMNENRQESSESCSPFTSEFFYHDMSPPQKPPTTAASQPSQPSQAKPKNYIFANQTPEDFDP